MAFIYESALVWYYSSINIVVTDNGNDILNKGAASYCFYNRENRLEILWALSV